MSDELGFSHGGAAGIGGLLVFFLRDFFGSTKKDLRETRDAVLKAAMECTAVARDMKRVEGILENQQGQLTSAVKEMARATASINALWTTLHGLGLVKRRPSDLAKEASGDDE